MIGKNVRINNSGFHPKEFFQTLWSTISKGKIWKGEIKNKARDGTIYWVDTTIIPFLNEQKHPYQYVAVRFDITKRKIAEEDLKKSVELFRNLFNFTPAAIVVSSLKDGKIINVNDAFLSLFKFSSKEEVIGKTALELKIYPNPEEQEKIENLLKTNKIVKDYEMNVFTKSGDSIWVSISLILLDIDAITSIFSVSVDITERKKAIEEIIVLNKELENKVNLRTSELLAANKELGQFAFIASHDLQEPLRTISNYLGLLKKKYFTELGKEKDIEQYFQFILGANSRMQSLIRDLLDYSRTGKQEKFESVDFNAILKELFKEMATTIKESNAQINSTLLPVLFGNAIEIKRLFQNLISNAIKFQKKNLIPKIEISAKESETDYIFSIKDNGIGIEEKYKEKIFVIFQRLHSVEEYPGTGIGLAICKKIVEQHHGKIWVESKLGEGSTFYFSFPKKN